MDTKRLKGLTYNCFMYMMAKGMLNNQDDTIKGLASFIYIFTASEHLTFKEMEDCVVYFFEEYSKGLRCPLPESYVRSTIAPAVLTVRNFDVPLGGSIYDIAMKNY